MNKHDISTNAMALITKGLECSWDMQNVSCGLALIETMITKKHVDFSIMFGNNDGNAFQDLFGELSRMVNEKELEEDHKIVESILNEAIRIASLLED